MGIQIENMAKEVIEKQFEKVGLDEKRISENIALLKDWIEQQPHLPLLHHNEKVLEKYVLRWNSVEECKDNIKNWYKKFNINEEYMWPINFQNEEFEKYCSNMYHLYLPKLTAEGCRIICLKFKTTDLDLYHFKSNWKFVIMQLIILLREEKYIPGRIVLIDCENLTIRQIPIFTSSVMKMVAQMPQETVPYSVVCTAVINASPVVEKLVNLMKSFVKEKMKQRLFVYRGGVENILNHVSKEYLPKEFGGEDFSLDDVHKQWMIKVKEYPEIYTDKKYLFGDRSIEPADEECETDGGSMFGVEGTFRKLDID